jgi:hypothetical protein
MPVGMMFGSETPKSLSDLLLAGLGWETEHAQRAISSQNIGLSQ